MGIEPTTSGLDLPLICWLSYEDRQRKTETIVVPWFPLLGLTPSGLFMGSISALIYTWELILCLTVCVHSATRHNIYMYSYFLFAAIHHHNRPRPSLSDLVAQSAE